MIIKEYAPRLRSGHSTSINLDTRLSLKDETMSEVTSG